MNNPLYYQAPNGDWIRRGEVDSIQILTADDGNRDVLQIRWMDRGRPATYFSYPSGQTQILQDRDTLFRDLCSAPISALVPVGDPVLLKDVPEGLFRCRDGWGFRNSAGCTEPIGKEALVIPDGELVQPYQIQ